MTIVVKKRLTEASYGTQWSIIREMEQLQRPLPQIHSVILFAHQQGPRLVKVISVNPEAPRPITIHLWKPNQNRTGLAQSRYRANMMNDEPDIMCVTPEQVKVDGLKWNTEGRFTLESQKKVKHYMKKHLTEVNESSLPPTPNESPKPEPAVAKEAHVPSKQTHSRYNLRPRT